MEDLKIILYILAIIAYFIYTAWRRAFKTPDEEVPPPAQERPGRERPAPRSTPTPAPQPRQQRPSAPATSFEDILREMQSKMERAGEQRGKKFEAPKPAPQPVAVERAPSRALSLEIPEQARMHEQQAKARRLAATAVAPNRQPEHEQPSRYSTLLRNPQTAREAFILSEIFNRKQY